MKRRKFIHTAGGALGLSFVFKGLNLSAMARSPLFANLNVEDDRVLVLIQLNGGNDGLNTFIPLDQYDSLINARSNIIIPENAIIPVADTLGFHPNLAALQPLFEEGKMGIVQGIGYPNQNRSHFRSKDIWTSASPAAEYWNTGWLGRYFDAQYPGFPYGYPNEEMPDPIAIAIGSTVSETCQGLASNYSLTLRDPFSLSPLTEGEAGEVPQNPYGEELQFLRTTIAQTNAYSEVVIQAAENGTNLATYPENNPLANALRNVALLIAGGLQTKVYVVSLGGFDTHANQVIEGEPLSGEHAELLLQLSEAVASFQEDLAMLGLNDRVLGMTFSEFGRRIKSNDSLGTDHGTAAPLMFFGECVNPNVLGDNPEIPEEVSNNEGVPMQFDFRNVYGSVLMDWLRVDEADIRSLLHPEFKYLPVLANCNPETTAQREAFYFPIETQCFPNPFQHEITIAFKSAGEQLKLSVFDALGQEIQVLIQKRLPPGNHQIQFNARGLAPGSYYYRLQLDSRQKTKRIVKL